MRHDMQAIISKNAPFPIAGNQEMATFRAHLEKLYESAREINIEGIFGIPFRLDDNYIHLELMYSTLLNTQERYELCLLTELPGEHVQDKALHAKQGKLYLSEEGVYVRIMPSGLVEHGILPTKTARTHPT
jgi:hypothetical protein